MKSKVKFARSGDKAYVWSFATSDGTAITVLSGGVARNGNAMWRAVILHKDGERFTIPEGGALTGYADTRKRAVERVLDSYARGAHGRWLEIMNH